MPLDIVLEDVRIAFDGTAVLTDVTATVACGTLSGLIGPSCGGKSVLLKSIAGIQAYDSGLISGVPEQLSLMFQEGALFDSLSVFDNVAFPLVDGRVPTSRLPRARQRELYDVVSEILGRVGLAWALHKMPGELSGGMRRRVSLARALVNRPKLVLLDDPTSGLDPVASSVIMELVVELQQEFSSTMIIASHDLRRLLPIVDDLLCLFDGHICFQGTVDELACSEEREIREFVSCRFDL